MANKKQTDKRREDECLDSVAEALLRFDASAPDGTYKMDRVGNRLLTQHATTSFLSSNLPMLLRLRVKHSFRKALSRCQFDLEFPSAKRRATEFFDALAKMRQLAAQIGGTEFEKFSPLLLTKSSPFDDEGKILDPSTEAEGIGGATRDLLLKIEAVTSLIDHYVDNIRIPEFSKPKSNRTIRFTYYLIGDLTRGWADIFGKDFEPTDLSDGAELIAAGLEDFQYPLTKTQLESRAWLSDRIRKQMFRNLNARFFL